jgi:hypothetical protein
MTYRFDELTKLASEQGLEWRRVDDNRLDVTVATDAVLAFCNLLEDNDTHVGFDGTPWHSHGVVQFTLFNKPLEPPATQYSSGTTCEEFGNHLRGNHLRGICRRR